MRLNLNLSLSISKIIILFIFIRTIIQPTQAVFISNIINSLTFIFILFSIFITFSKNAKFCKPLFMLFFLFLLSDFVSMFQYFDFRLYVLLVLFQLIFSLSYCYLFNFIDELIKYISYMTLILICYAFVQLALGDYFIFHSDWQKTVVSSKAIRSVFSHPNAFSLFLGVSYTIALAKLLYQGVTWRRLIYISLIIIGLLISKGRTVGFGIFFVTFFQFYFRGNISRIIIIIGALTFSLFFYGWGDLDLNIQSFYWRISFWAAAAEEGISQKNAFIGNGSGFVYYLIENKLGHFGGIKTLHNDYLFFLLSVGFLGTAIFFMSIINIMFSQMMRLKGSTLNEKYFVHIISISLIIYMMIVSVAESVFFATSFQITFWALLAISSKLTVINKETSVINEKS